MKKILISAIALSSCLILAGCGGTSEEAAITNLSNQLDKLNNVIANTTVVNTNSIDLTNFSNGSDTGAIKNIYQKTISSINKEEEFKNVIKNKTAIIKKHLSLQDIKLGSNTKALQELSNSLSKYTSKLYSTNPEYRKVAKNISKIKSNSQTSNTSLGAKLTRLSSCSDSRLCYYNNILTTLNQINSLLNEGAIVDENINLNNNYFNKYDTNKMYNFTNDHCDNCYPTNNTPYYNINQNNYCQNGNCQPNQINNTQNYSHNSNHYNNYQKRNLANNGYRNGSFNPNRNTDTYGPGVTNIDTYRNYNNGIYNNYNKNYTNGFNNITDDLTKTNMEDTTKKIINEEKQNYEDLSQKPKTLELTPEDYDLEKPKEEHIFKHKTKDIKDEDLIDSRIDNHEVISEEASTLELEKKDKNPIENLRLKLKTEKLENHTGTSSALISKDYESTNKKIKDLIENDKISSSELTSNMLHSN